MDKYKAMYFHLVEQMTAIVEALEGLVTINEKLKQTQQSTEEIFLNGNDDECG